MLHLEPKKNESKTDEQIRAEINWMLQRSNGYLIRVVYGFVKRLCEINAAEEMEVAA